jgi:hypothetical protein
MSDRLLSKCNSATKCARMHEVSALVDDLSECRRTPDDETKTALAFLMTAVVTGSCPACHRPIGPA